MGTVKNILLTGATGYLGKNLLIALVKADYNVVVLVRRSSNLDKIKGINKVKVFFVDEDFNEILSIANIDTVIHTAALYGRKGESITDIIDANLTFPIKLLEACIKNKIKNFINTDTSLPKLLNPYSLTKNHFLDWLKLNGSKIKVLNLQLEYFFGPNDDTSKFITYVVRKIQDGATSIDFTDATPFRDFIYIDDLISAYLVIIKNIEIFNLFTNIPIGYGKAFMLKDIIIQIKNTVGVESIKLNFGALPMRPNEIMYSCANIEILTSLGWKPTYNLTDGLKKLLIIEKQNYDTN